jgi:hypothetical protein
MHRNVGRFTCLVYDIMTDDAHEQTFEASSMRYRGSIHQVLASFMGSALP